MTQPRRQSGIVSLLTREDAYVSGPQVLSELRRVIASGRVPPGSGAGLAGGPHALRGALPRPLCP